MGLAETQNLQDRINALTRELGETKERVILIEEALKASKKPTPRAKAQIKQSTRGKKAVS